MALINYWRTRGLLGVGAVLACVLAWGMSTTLGVPAAGIRAGSLLAQPSPAFAVIMVAGAMLVAFTLGVLIAGRIRPDAGVFCAAIALAAISWHSGTMREVFFEVPAPAMYTRMAIECLLLLLLLGVLQAITLALTKRDLLKEDAHRDGVDAPSATPGELGLATVATALAFGLLAWFFVATDNKQQAMLGVAAAAWIASAGVHYLLVPSAPSWPGWAGVLLGAAGCFAFASTSPGIPSIGWVVIPPARALPLDHAGAGVAAAILGYWYSRTWKRAADQEALHS